jgi:hypothetical protein
MLRLLLTRDPGLLLGVVCKHITRSASSRINFTEHVGTGVHPHKSIAVSNIGGPEKLSV